MGVVEMVIRLPDWVGGLLEGLPERLPRQEDRLGVALALARENVRRGSGGPFGAAVFDGAGRLVSAGVNLVVSAGSSILHAEMVALALAQRRLGCYDLSAGAGAPYELCSSTEPCAMCFGAIPWSGVTRLVCAARDEDARAVGFDEGAKLPDWVGALAARGIAVVRDLRREEGAAILRDYAAAGGAIYNPGGRPAPVTAPV